VPLKSFAGGATIVSAPHGHTLIVGGERRWSNDLEGDDYLVLVAYTHAGRLDRHFGKGGVARSRLSSNSRHTGVSPHAITFDASGDMIVVGRLGIRTVDTPAGDGFLARYTPRGRDCSFGTGGAVVDERFGAADAVAVQPDGRIVIAGWGGGFLAARYMGGASHTCAGEPAR